MSASVTGLTSRFVGRATLLALVLAAFGLRLFLLDGQSLWYDEGVTALVGQMDPAALTRWTAADIQPPLYYYLVAAWGRLAGWGEWSLRFLSVWCGVLLVPLMAVLVMRLTRHASAALLAAFLTAFHPLLVYYSQEARMYALLLVWGVIAGYCVVRLGEGERRPTLWLAYVAAATAAIYTHYFAFFLLLALAIAYLIDVRTELRRGLRPFILADLGVLLLYLPWLWVMVAQLRQDTSYWQGELKLGEALAEVAISFTSGETVFEAQALWLLIGYALVTAIALVGLWRAPDQRRTLRYGLLWLALPVAAVLLLASIAPKFNARYVMLALPGLIILWAGGLGQWAVQIAVQNAAQDAAQTAARKPGAQRTSWSPGGLIAALSVLFLALGFGYANVNWFVNPAFTKDDWRGVTDFLRPRLQEQEAIALISGHAWPVWDYYAPDLPALRLPDLSTLDVDAVLDFADTAIPLQESLDPLSDRPGIWLIGWQDDVIDPTGVVPAQLTIAGKEKGLDTAYWGLSLRRYSQLKTHWIPDAPPIDHPTDIQFGDALRLRGYTAIDNGDLLLFWQRVPGVEMDSADFVMSGEVYDAAGTRIGTLPDLPPAGFDYPAHRWPEERLAMGVVPAQAWLGEALAPGQYSVTLRLYDDSGRQRTLVPTVAGEESVTLAPIEVVIE